MLGSKSLKLSARIRGFSVCFGGLADWTVYEKKFESEWIGDSATVRNGSLLQGSQRNSCSSVLMSNNVQRLLISPNSHKIVRQVPFNSHFTSSIWTTRTWQFNWKIYVICTTFHRKCSPFDSKESTRKSIRAENGCNNFVSHTCHDQNVYHLVKTVIKPLTLIKRKVIGQ